MEIVPDNCPYCGGMLIPLRNGGYECSECGMKTDITPNEPEIKCPKCNSAKWRCYNESEAWFVTPDGEYYEYPVGDLVCLDCGTAYTHTDTTDQYVGQYLDNI